MAADFLVASLPALPFDGPAPFSAAEFVARCREQLGEFDADGIAAVMNSFAFKDPGPGAAHPLARRWADLETQLRNALAAERARILGADASRFRRHAEGCSIFWAGRIGAAFAESDPMKRERALDRVWWDAAGELVPVASPLSKGALFAYAVRLAVSIKRSAFSIERGNVQFERIASALAQP